MSVHTYLLVLPWPSHHAGGVNIVVKNLAAALRVESALRPLVAVDTWGATAPRCADDGDTLFQFSLLGAGFGGFLRGAAMLPLRLLRLLRFLRRENVVVANFHYVGATALGVAILKQFGLYRGRLVLSFHGEDAKPARSASERWAIRWAIRQADALVAVSHGLARRVAAAFNLPLERVSVIYNGVDHAVFRPDAKSDSPRVAAVPTPFIVSVSSYIPRKNLGCLLEAFATIADEYPALHLCFAGADGPEREPLQARAHALGLFARVHFLMALTPEETAHLLARATACVQPARAEGLGLAVLEAAATMRPVALTKIIGHEELVDDGSTGVFFRSEDSRDCARAIRLLLNDPERAQAMAEALRRRTLSEFTWRSCLAAYSRLLRLAEFGPPVPSPPVRSQSAADV